MEIKRNDILAVKTEKDLSCSNCATDQDIAAVETAEQVLTAEAVQKADALLFCDRCSKRIKAAPARR
jgi:hypothetical protein